MTSLTQVGKNRSSSLARRLVVSSCCDYCSHSRHLWHAFSQMTRSQERRTPSEPSRNTIAMPTAPPHDGIRTWATRFDPGGHSLARTVLRQHRSFCITWISAQAWKNLFAVAEVAMTVAKIEMGPRCHHTAQFGCAS